MIHTRRVQVAVFAKESSEVWAESCKIELCFIGTWNSAVTCDDS